jgi:hypothetical protein
MLPGQFSHNYRRKVTCLPKRKYVYRTVTGYVGHILGTQVSGVDYTREFQILVHHLKTETEFNLRNVV